MPRHLKLKKDATNGETRRGVVRTQRSVDIRMGKPVICNRMASMDESIVHERGTRRTETSKYPEEKKTKVITIVAASEREGAQTISRDGVVGPRHGKRIVRRTALKGRPQGVQVPYPKTMRSLVGS